MAGLWVKDGKLPLCDFLPPHMAKQIKMFALAHFFGLLFFFFSPSFSMQEVTLKDLSFLIRFDSLCMTYLQAVMQHILNTSWRILCGLFSPSSI